MTTAVRHVARDTLVGFTELNVAAETHRPVFNHNTLVISEHRGHRLGMLIKAANLRLLAETAPGHPAIYTWNAEENRHMLDVNEKLGFVPVGYEGSWKKVICEAQRRRWQNGQKCEPRFMNDSRMIGRPQRGQGLPC